MLWTLLVTASKSGYGGAYGENYIYAGKDEFSQAACAGIDCDSTWAWKRFSRKALHTRWAFVINHEPDYLIVLYLNKNGNIYEVYNGTGKQPWNTASKKDSHNNRHMRVNKLIELDENVADNDRIEKKHYIEKMKPEYKNRK